MVRYHKPQLTQKLDRLQKKYWDIIECISMNKENVILKFKKGYVSDEGSNYIFAKNGADMVHKFKFKKVMK